MKIKLLLIASLAFVLGGVPKDRFDPCIFVPEECNKVTTPKPVAKLTTKATISASTQGTTPKSAQNDFSLDKEVASIASNMVKNFPIYSALVSVLLNFHFRTN